MTSTATGQRAEAAVSDYLKRQGFKILNQNWKTRWCEIDIVARKKKTIYFVEVKFRQTDEQGDGLEYITSSKLRQMGYAAEFWCHENDWKGNYELAAVPVASDDLLVGELVLCS